ncbi:MAG: extracellular solute-binding protein [Candidatus Latescibacterota bacterium]
MRSLLVMGAGALLASCGPRPEGEAATHLAVLMAPDATGVWREVFADFHRQNPDVAVDFVEGPSATNTREDLYVASFLSGESAYDLVFADVVWVPEFAAAGWLADLTARWPAERWQRFLPGAMAGSTYGGRIYRVPTQMDGGMLFYRTDLLQAAGEDPPRALGDLVRLARQLQRPDELWGFVWQGKQYEGLVCDFLEVLRGHGGTWIEPQTGTVGLDRPEAIRALEFLVNCIGPEGISPPGVTTYTEEESRQLFHAGRALFHRNWPYVWPLVQRDDSPVLGKVWMMPMPADAGGVSVAALGGWGFGIAAGTPHREAAWRFIAYVSDLPQARRVYERSGGLPALRAFYEQSEDPATRAIYEVLQRAEPRPPLPQYAQASDILQRYVGAALTRRMDAAEALLLDQRFAGRRAARAAALVPWALPTAVLALAWVWIVNDQFGVLNDLLARLGLIGAPVAWLGQADTAMLALVVADVWKTTPFVTIILLAGLQGIPGQLHEAGQIDGAGPWARFRLITLPLLVPSIFLALLFRVIHSLGIFDLVYVMTGGGPGGATETLSLYTRPRATPPSSAASRLRAICSTARWSPPPPPSCAWPLARWPPTPSRACGCAAPVPCWGCWWRSRSSRPSSSSSRSTSWCA